MKTKDQLRWIKPDIIHSLSEEEVYNKIRNDDLQVRGTSHVPPSPWKVKIDKLRKKTGDSYPPSTGGGGIRG